MSIVRILNRVNKIWKMVKEKVKDVERKVGFTILSRVNKVWKIIKCY